MPQSIVIAGTHKQVTAALHKELPDWDFDHLESYLLDIVIETPQYEVIPLKSFFENLKSKGFLLGVMTNDAEKSARAHLINAGVYSLLDFVAGSDTGYGVKPNAEPLLAFSKQTDLQPNEVAMVGDSLHDLKAAHAAGMVGIAVLTGMATEDQLKKHAALIESKKAIALEAPVSGGCHRAATGNISIFVGGKREGFEKALPVLSCLGRRILHVGDFGSASILKVITNYLATVNLVSLGEAWTIAKKSGLDLNKAFKGIAASSGNSFVHETESQVILNGSYNINFTMDLVLKDTGLFDNLAKKLNAPLEISPKIVEIFKDGQKKYGPRAWSSMIVKRMEDLNKIDFRADGFPDELVDNEPEEKGYEI